VVPVNVSAVSARPADDVESMRSAQQGDRQAFAALAQAHWERLFRWLYHLTHDTAQAEDLAQETFLRALAGLGSFEAGTNFRAWLFRIAHNLWLNERRGGQKQRLPFPRELADRLDSPVDAAIDREQLAELARAVGRLPGDFRAAFLLRAEEGLSFREIGEVLEISEETARWRVYQARKKLMNVMQAYLE
jgi:RNA polymerase sigma-70 factor, ECF subfamily